MLEPPDTGTGWNLNRAKRNLGLGYLSNLFFFAYKISIGLAGGGFFFELPAALGNTSLN